MVIGLNKKYVLDFIKNERVTAHSFVMATNGCLAAWVSAGSGLTNPAGDVLADH